MFACSSCGLTTWNELRTTSVPKTTFVAEAKCVFWPIIVTVTVWPKFPEFGVKEDKPAAAAAAIENGAVNAILTYTMTNALVSSVSVGGGGGGKPQETVTFNYTKIQWDYKLQAAAVSDSGSNQAKWSLETNKAE